MSRLGPFLSSSIGKKLLMSLTGLALLGFLVVHLAGNTLILVDPSGGAFEAYAQRFHDNPAFLYAAEVGLVLVFGLHIYLAFRLTLENREARRTRYRVRATRGEQTPASGSMIVTGSIILVFLIVHLTDFRFAVEPEEMANAVVRRLSHATGFAIYLVGVVAVLVHLTHAVRSALQTLGWNHPRWNPLLKRGGLTVAVLLGLGFATFPLWIYAQSGRWSAALAAEESADAAATPQLPHHDPHSERGAER